MATPYFLLVLSLVLSSPLITASTSDNLSEGSSLSVENPNDVLVSSNGTFSAGFYPVGVNAYCFAIWFNKPVCGNNCTVVRMADDDQPVSRELCENNCTVVWMANRDQPINGKRSKLSLLKTGDLILTDAGRIPAIWATGTASVSSVRLRLDDTGNLVLRNLNGVVLWQSFDSPTDTLLPLQPLTKNIKLVSSRSQTNYSSGYYKLFFDDDNVLRLLFDGPNTSSIYWPPPWLVSFQAGRTAFNNSRIAVLDLLGKFTSSDDLNFQSDNYGTMMQRRLTVDFDGNLRLYSREEGRVDWVVSWQAMSQPCWIHGICGANGVCRYFSNSTRQCSCLPGFKMINPAERSLGCEPEFRFPITEPDFIPLPQVDFYGYDVDYSSMEFTFEQCRNSCSTSSNCRGFQYSYDEGNRAYRCYPKALLLNGHRSPGFTGVFYLKLPKSSNFSANKLDEDFRLNCPDRVFTNIPRIYVKSQENGSLKFLVWFASAFGGVEVIGIFLMWCFLMRTRRDSGVATEGYQELAAAGFKRFSYAELKKATRNFSEEIGRGAGGIVYKGILSDNRVTAIKRLHEANQGEAEFLAEVSTIGNLNHMNLIAMWGYCVEGKHRLLVYEYMEHGSLAENLSSNALDWEKRFEIALGTAKGLAYLHEECLEWVLHCDVKPQNILLDSKYHPKVSDFGLSKLLRRDTLKTSSFSRIRGTRGYMAPEWIFNQPISSKVDVYSYGIVVLEMVTGKSPTTGVQAIDDGVKKEHRSLVTWLREKMNGAATVSSWMEDAIDPTLEGKYDMGKMEILVEVALKCAEENKDARPTMSQVVEMLLR